MGSADEVNIQASELNRTLKVEASVNMMLWTVAHFEMPGTLHLP